jgi:hypothetical protein
MEAPPESFSCDAAESLEMGGPAATANTTAHLPHGLNNDECSLHPYSRGQFYSVSTSTGKGIRVTLEASLLGALTEGTRLEVAVMTAECQTCVIFSDFLTAEDLPHTMELGVTPGQPYVLVVSGEGFSDVGMFQVKVEVRQIAPPRKR